MQVTKWSASALLLLASNAALGQQATKSTGQPPRWEPYVVGGVTRPAYSGWVGALSAGVHKPIMSPVTGVLGLAAEGYKVLDDDGEWGARLLATSRLAALAAGVDWDNRSGGFHPVVSYQSAIRRGGLLGYGTMLRLDWLPAGRDRLSVGLHVPIGQPLGGRTRPRDTKAGFSKFPRTNPSTTQLTPELETALSRLSESAGMILAYTNIYPDLNPELRYGQSYAAGTRQYHAALTELFGDSIARRARANVLEMVILPYDSLFGQVKENEESIRELTSAAQARFTTWLRDSSRVSPASQATLSSVHARWLGIIEVLHRHLMVQWKDSRLAWMPLQLALTEEQYDEQSEVDALIERIVGRPFTDNNALTYLRTSDLPLEIARSIFATRDYHVLWTHDFTARREKTGEIDEISYIMVADAYFPALTKAVQRYDSTKKMPVYVILHDQYYYEARSNRIWLSILEDPLNAKITLPSGNADKEAHLRERQAELRRALGASRRPPAASSVKVHVNVVGPSDVSFRSHHIVPRWPFVPDNITRDHRKLVFYDLTESDPYRGALMIHGVGIGEHYASPTWEDRGYRVRGPAALEVRAAVRRALIRNGFKESDIPGPLQPTESAKAAEERADVRDYIGRALHAHNEAGFGAKQSSVVRAMLYNLAPPGSVIIVPDPLWLSHTWAAMLSAAAARGCRVFIISPSAPNSPNPQKMVAAIQNDVMWRLLQLRTRLAEQMRLTGGELRVGLYTARALVNDPVARGREVREGLRRNPWIRQLIPFDSATLAVLNPATTQTEADATDTAPLAKDERPRFSQLHQKTQLIARPGAIAAFVSQPGWDDVLARSMRVQAQQAAKFADEMNYATPDIDSSATRSADAMLRGFEQSIPEAERKAVSFYFTLGSQNMDARGLMQDGESTIVVSGLHAAAGVVDLYYMMARTTWIETKAELDRLIPAPKGLMAKVARILRNAL